MTNAPTTRETADHAELARLAEAAAKGEWWSDDDVISHQEVSREDERFIYAFTPAVCSALLSEIAALRGDLTVSRDDLDQLQAHFRQRDREATQAERQRDELRKALERLASSEAFETPRVIDGPLAPEMRARMSYARQALANQGADQ